MPYHIETASEGFAFPKGTGIVVDSKTGKHFSRVPIKKEKAIAKINMLEMVSQHRAHKQAYNKYHTKETLEEKVQKAQYHKYFNR